MGVAMQGLSKIFRAPIIKIIRYRAHRAVIFAIAWHLVLNIYHYRHMMYPLRCPNFPNSQLTQIWTLESGLDSVTQDSMVVLSLLRLF